MGPETSSKQPRPEDTPNPAMVEWVTELYPELEGHIKTEADLEEVIAMMKSEDQTGIVLSLGGSNAEA